MPTITIDGQSIEAPNGAMLLPVALENGIHIPHYCWHPKLSIDGSCRMCQVEVEGSPKLVIACNMPIRDGMVVRTTTPAVQNTRRGVMELLLVNHPLDCPICDKAGECLLQDYSYAYGSRHTRTQEPRRKLEKRKDIGPRMILDQERCILCRRCVRFCREITGTNELGVFNLGDHTVLDVMDGAPLANDYSINTADICPVGALESKDFHHKLRVWFLKKTPSVCPSCSNGCNVTVHHYRDRVWRMMPRRNDAVNETWMCDHGRLNYPFVNAPERLRQPLLRRSGALEACDWEDAIAETARQLRHAVRTHGAGAVGAIVSPHLTNEEHFRFAQLLRTLGIANADVAVVLGQSDHLLIKAEKAANARGARDMGLQPAAGSLGVSAMVEAAARGDIRVLYVCGPDLPQLVDPELLERAVASLECLIVQDVAGSPLAERAHLVLPSLTFAEKTGTFTNHAGRVQQIHQAVNPPDGQPSDGEIFSRLLSYLSEGHCSFEPADVLTEIAAAVPAYAGITFAGVGPLGWATAAQPAPGSGHLMATRAVVMSRPRPRGRGRGWIMGTRAILHGVWIAQRHFLRNLWGFIRRKPTVFTVQFPEQRLTQPNAFRGMPVLVQMDNGKERCVACGLCEWACPTDCITIYPAETADEIERFPAVFDIDMSRCMYCGLCEEACPEEAIVMSQKVEIAAFSRRGTLWHKQDLLVPVDQLTDTRLHHVRRSYDK